MTKNEGIIIYSKKIKERDLYIKILSNKDELISGMVYAGDTSKKKLIFQIGYFIEFILIQKNKNIVPYFNAEITKPFLESIMRDKFKLYGLLTIISLVNISIIEGQKVIGFYSSVKKIVKIMSTNKHWISYFCEWLLNLLKIIGYQIDYNNKKQFKYYSFKIDDFIDYYMEDSIIFPHRLLNHKDKIIFFEVKAVFEIFENIFCKNHLDNINYKMPAVFYNFKNTILKELN